MALSFGALNKRGAARDVVSELAIINWYKFLWHVVHRQMKAPLLEHRKELEVSCEMFLHTYPRSDTKLTVCLFKVWAHIRCINYKLNAVTNTHAFQQAVSFDISEQNDSLDSFLNLAAKLLVYPVCVDYIPEDYRRPSCMNFEEDLFELSDSGVLCLFSAWHLALLDRLWINATEISFSEDQPNVEITEFGTEDILRLNAIDGCKYIPAQCLYSRSSDENAYARIKNCSLDFDKQALAAGELFDSNPANYKTSLIGFYYYLAKIYGLEFYFADEVLFSKESGIWLQLDASRRLVALVCDQTVVAYSAVDDQASFYLALQDWKIALLAK